MLRIQAIKVKKIDNDPDGGIETKAWHDRDVQPLPADAVTDMLKWYGISLAKHGDRHISYREGRYSWMAKGLEDFKGWGTGRYCEVTLICGEVDAEEAKAKEPDPHICRYCQFWGGHDMEADVLDSFERYAECLCRGIVEKDKDNCSLPSQKYDDDGRRIQAYDEDGFLIPVDEFIGDVAICCDGKFRTTQNFGCVHWKGIERSE